MDMDARIARINAMIEELGLADASGDTSGLRARYDEERDVIVIADDDYAEYFDADVTDDELLAYLEAFLDDE